MPAPDPQEFRDGVVHVARTREDGVTLARIAKDFGIHEMTLSTWMRQADTDNGEKPASREPRPQRTES
ncbi:transposase [Micrococcus luteus]|uniref:transposase n=1 Tax=Micrococcus luteus TaxID=1270 RepID=UPI000C7E4AEE|nr:transposase [Micrococcus luteus]PLA45608.1 transposase [Micrococcus luteus]